MNTTRKRPWRLPRGRRYLAMLIGFLVLLGATVVYAVSVKRDRGDTPKLLNRPTAAREVRPLTDKPDPRFAPLPIEREKHGR